jgi:hypothetical protein
VWFRVVWRGIYGLWYHFRPLLSTHPSSHHHHHHTSPPPPHITTTTTHHHTTTQPSLKPNTQQHHIPLTPNATHHQHSPNTMADKWTPKGFFPRIFMYIALLVNIAGVIALIILIVTEFIILVNNYQSYVARYGYHYRMSLFPLSYFLFNPSSFLFPRRYFFTRKTDR